MPTLTVNDTTLTFGNIWYVDSIKGHDRLHDGSLEYPLKTFYEAVRRAANGDAVFFLPGVHDIAHYSWGNKAYGLRDEGKQLTFIGDAESRATLLLDGSKFSTNYGIGVISTENIGTQIINLDFEVRGLGSRSGNWQRAIVGLTDGYPARGVVHNCSFRFDGSPALNYDNYSTSDVTFNYCTFFSVGWSGSYNNAARVKLNYCVCNYTIPDGTRTGNLYNASIDPNTYMVNSDSVGVYRGTYAWDTPDDLPSSIVVNRVETFGSVTVEEYRGQYIQAGLTVRDNRLTDIPSVLSIRIPEFHLGARMKIYPADITELNSTLNVPITPTDGGGDLKSILSVGIRDRELHARTFIWGVSESDGLSGSLSIINETTQSNIPCTLSIHIPEKELHVRTLIWSDRQDSELTSSVDVKYVGDNYLNGSIHVKPYNSAIGKSVIWGVRENDVSSTIDAKYRGNEDLRSSIWTTWRNSMDGIAFIWGVEDFDMPSKILAVYPDFDEIVSKLNVRSPYIYDPINKRFGWNMKSTITTIGKRDADLNSAIGVRMRNRMTGTSDIRGYGESDLDSVISVKQIYDIPSSIGIYPHNKMTGIVDIRPPIRMKEIMYAVADSYIREASSKLNYGGDTSIAAGFSPSRAERFRTLLAFDTQKVLDLLPEHKIEKVVLKLKFPTGKEPVFPLKLHEVDGEWTEYGVTWYNSPQLGSELTSGDYVIDSINCYVEFDITDRINAARANGEGSLDFYLVAKDETSGYTQSFYARHLGEAYAPLIEVTYFDDLIRSTGRSNLDSKLLVVYPDSSEIESSLFIKSYWTDADLDSVIHVLQPGQRESSIIVSRPDMLANIEVRDLDDFDIVSSIAVRESWYDDFDGSLVVNKLVQPSSIYVANRYDMPSKVAVRRWGQPSDIFSWGYVSERVRPGSIYVFHRAELPSKIAARQVDRCDIDICKLTVSRPNLVGNVGVPFRSDLQSSIVSGQFGESEIESSIAVHRPDMLGKVKVHPYTQLKSRLRVRRKGEPTGFNGSIIAHAPTRPGSIYVRFNEDIPSKLAVQRDGVPSDVSGWIIVSNPDILSTIHPKIHTHLEGQIAVRRTESDDLESKLYVLNRSDLDGSVEVWFASMIPSILRVLGGNLKSKIGIPTYTETDKPSTIIVRRSEKSDINGSIDVKQVSDLPSTISARGTVHVPIPSKIVVRRNENSNISGSIDVWQLEDLASKVVVRRSYISEFASSLYVLANEFFDCVIEVTNRADLKGVIDVKHARFHDLPGTLLPKIREASDLDSLLEIKYSDFSDLESRLNIPPTNKMSGIIEIVDVPRTKYPISPYKDAFVSEKIANLNYGANGALAVGNSSIYRYRSLLGFNISDVTTSSVVERVVLKLFFAEAPVLPLKLCRVDGSWSEYGVTWVNAPQISDVIVDTYEVHEGYIEFDVTEFILDEHFKLNPNVDFYLVAVNEEGQYESFYSRETAQKPTLEFTYYDPEIINFDRANLEGKIQLGHRVDLNSRIKVVPPLQWLSVDADMLTMYAWDSGAQDGDIVNVYRIGANGEKVLLRSNWYLKNIPYTNSTDFLDIPIDEGLNIIVFEGVSPGSSGDLTADMKLLEGGSRNRNGKFPPLWILNSSGQWVKLNSNEFQASIKRNASTLTGNKYNAPLPARTWRVLRVVHREIQCSLEVTRNNLVDGSIAVSRPDLLSSITVRDTDWSEIPSLIAVSVDDFKSLDGAITVSKPDVPSKLYVPERSDLPSKVVVKQEGDSTLFSWGMISRSTITASILVPERVSVIGRVVVRGENEELLDSSISVSRPDLPASVVAKVFRHFNMLSTIRVKREDSDEIDGVISVQKPDGSNVESGLAVSRPDFIGQIVVQQVGDNDLDGRIVVPADSGETEVESLIAITRATVDCSLTVLDRVELPSTIAIRAEGGGDLPGCVAVSRATLESSLDVHIPYDTGCSIVVRVTEEHDFYSEIRASRPDVLSSIYVLEHNDLSSSIVVRVTEGLDTYAEILVSRPDAPSVIYVLERKDIPSSIGIPTYDSYDLSSSVLISRPNMLGTADVYSAWTKMDNDIPSSLDVWYASHLPSSLRVISGNLKSKIGIWGYHHYDIPSSIAAAVRFISEIESSLLVLTERSHLPSYISVRQYNEMQGRVEQIIGLGEADLPSSIAPVYMSDLPSRMGVRLKNKMTGTTEFIPVGDDDLESTLEIPPSSIRHCRIEVRRSDSTEIPGSLIPRVYGESDISGSIEVIYRGDADLPSTLSISHYNKMTGDVFIVPVGDSDIPSSIQVQEWSQLVCSIIVRRSDQSDIDGQIYVFYHDDLPSVIWLRLHSDLESSIVVRRTDWDDLHGEIDVRREDKSDIPAELVISRPDLLCQLYVRPYVSLPCSIVVRRSDWNDLPGRIQPRYGDEIPCSIYVLHRGELDCRIEVMTDYPYAFIM